MKPISDSMNNLDRKKFQQIASGLPEIREERQVNIQAIASMFNGLFRELCAIFPYLSSKSQADLDEMRRQWVQSFAENGIWNSEQISAGLRIARKQEKPFVPSPGQFVAWCKSEEAAAVGLPDVNELMDMIYRYCRTRGLYPDAESYPWERNEHYWLVTGLYTDMRANALSDSELRRKASEDLSRMVRRLNAGEVIPAPVKQIPKLGGRPLSKEQGLNKIAEIRAKFGLGRERNHG